MVSERYQYEGKLREPPSFSSAVYLMLDSFEDRPHQRLKANALVDVTKHYRRVLKQMGIIKVEGKTRGAVVTLGERALYAIAKS